MSIMQRPPPLSHGLMTIYWLFLRLFNADFSCNIRLLQVFLHRVLTEMMSCSVRVEKLVKVGFSKEYCVCPTGPPLKEGGGGGTYHECYYEKILCYHGSLELIPKFICVLFERFGGVGTKDKSLVSA